VRRAVGNGWSAAEHDARHPGGISHNVAILVSDGSTDGTMAASEAKLGLSTRISSGSITSQLAEARATRAVSLKKSP
jgi:hypothetical protein